MKSLIKKINEIRNTYPSAIMRVESSDGKHFIAAVGPNSGCYTAITTIERLDGESFDEAKNRAFEEACQMAGMNPTSVESTIRSISSSQPRKRNKISSGRNKIIDLTDNAAEDNNQIGIFDVIEAAKNDSSELDSADESDDASEDTVETVETVEKKVEKVEALNEINEVIEESAAPDESDATEVSVANDEEEVIEEVEESEEGEEDAELDKAMRYVIGFGKYKGNTLGDILAGYRGVSYIKWIAYDYSCKNKEGMLLQKYARLIVKNMQD